MFFLNEKVEAGLNPVDVYFTLIVFLCEAKYIKLESRYRITSTAAFNL